MKKCQYIELTPSRFIVAEKVPARVCRETGEQLFSPETVNRLQVIIHPRLKPTRVIETPVYEFAAEAA